MRVCCRGFLLSLRMPLTRLDPRVISDLCDIIESQITEKVKSYIRSEMELMKNDMVTEIMRTIDGIPQNVGTEDGYEEAAEEFETVGSSGDDRRNRSTEDRIARLPRLAAQFSNSRMKVSTFSSTLKPENLIDWIGELEDFFELEEIEDPLRVRLAQTKLKARVSLWWKELQRDREDEGEIKINRWRLMVTKLKANFIPADYELDLFKKLQNLKQKDLSVEDYTEEFYKLTIRSRH